MAAPSLLAGATFVIHSALVVDGTGSEPFLGSVAARGPTIIEVARHPDRLKCAISSDATIIDGDGGKRMVAPGWVDAHTHLDGQVTWDAAVTPLAQNGVTTVVAGNCGVGFAPCKREGREFLMGLMEGVGMAWSGR